MSLAQIEHSEIVFVFCFCFSVKNMRKAPNKGAFALGLPIAGRGGARSRKTSAHHWEEWGVGALLLGVTSRRSPERTPATHKQDRHNEPMPGHVESLLDRSAQSRSPPLEWTTRVHGSVTVLNWGPMTREVGRKEKPYCLGNASMGKTQTR